MSTIDTSDFVENEQPAPVNYRLCRCPGQQCNRDLEQCKRCRRDLAHDYVHWNGDFYQCERCAITEGHDERRRAEVRIGGDINTLRLNLDGLIASLGAVGVRTWQGDHQVTDHELSNDVEAGGGPTYDVPRHCQCTAVPPL